MREFLALGLRYSLREDFVVTGITGAAGGAEKNVGKCIFFEKPYIFEHISKFRSKNACGKNSFVILNFFEKTLKSNWNPHYKWGPTNIASNKTH